MNGVRVARRDEYETLLVPGLSLVLSLRRIGRLAKERCPFPIKRYVVDVRRRRIRGSPFFLVTIMHKSVLESDRRAGNTRITTAELILSRASDEPIVGEKNVPAPPRDDGDLLAYAKRQRLKVDALSTAWPRCGPKFRLATIGLAVLAIALPLVFGLYGKRGGSLPTLEGSALQSTGIIPAPDVLPMADASQGLFDIVECVADAGGSISELSYDAVKEPTVTVFCAGCLPSRLVAITQTRKTIQGVFPGAIRIAAGRWEYPVSFALHSPGSEPLTPAESEQAMAALAAEAATQPGTITVNRETGTVSVSISLSLGGLRPYLAAIKTVAERHGLTYVGLDIRASGPEIRVAAQFAKTRATDIQRQSLIPEERTLRQAFGRSSDDGPAKAKPSRPRVPSAAGPTVGRISLSETTHIVFTKNEDGKIRDETEETN